MKIIDAHAHVVQYIAGTGSQGELRACGNGEARYASGQKIKMIPDGMGEYGVTPEKLLEVMDANGVEKAVLLQGNYFGFQNLYTYESVKKYPNRFIGAATFDPYCKNKKKILTHLFDELGFRILKMEVSTGSGLMCNHETIPLDGQVMDEVYAYANEKNLVFVMDIGKMGSESSQIDALCNAIKRYPNMKFVVCHLLAPNLESEEQLTEGLIKLRLPNVWFDLAALPNNCKPEKYPYPTARHYVELAAKLVGANRLLFGSDIPSTLVADRYEHYISYILESEKLTQEEKRMILYENAKKYFLNRISRTRG